MSKGCRLSGRTFTFGDVFVASVTRKKLPNVYKSWPKMISLEKSITLTPSQKLPKYV